MAGRVCGNVAALLQQPDGAADAGLGKAHFRGDVDRADELQALGVNASSLSYQTSSTGALTGMTFVITGTLPSMKRDEATALISANGGKVSGSVSKKTTHLLAGEDAGSKLQKAKDLGTKIISEAELMAMLGM